MPKGGQTRTSIIAAARAPDTNALTILDYDQIPVSTYSFVVKSNVYFNMDLIHEVLPISDTPLSVRSIKYTGPVSKKTIHKTDVVRRGNTKKSPNMLHACTIQYMLPEKLVNVKLYNTGSMQITGCKSHDQCHRTIFGIYCLIMKHCPQGVYRKSASEARVIFNIEAVMKNIHFNVGFKVIRQKFAEYFAAPERAVDFDYVMTYDDQTSAGLNIKKIISHVQRDKIDQMIIGGDASPESKGFEVSEIEVDVRYKPAKSLTFILFHSGNCRYSGCNDKVMRQGYYDFVKLVCDHDTIYRWDCAATPPPPRMQQKDESATHASESNKLEISQSYDAISSAAAQFNTSSILKKDTIS